MTLTGAVDGEVAQESAQGEQGACGGLGLKAGESTRPGGSGHPRSNHSTADS